LLKQIIPIFIIYGASTYIVKKYSITYLFETYGKVVFIIAAIGILQVIFSFFNIYFFSENRFNIQIFGISFRRLNSVMTEPSHYAIMAIPYLVFLLIQKKKKRLVLYTLGLSIFLTFSLTAFAAVIISLSLHYIGKINTSTVFGILGVCFIGYILYINIEPVKYRIDETLKYYSTSKFENKTNATTFSLTTNLEAAFYSLKKNVILGSGIGGHEEVYDEYIKNIKKSHFVELYDRHKGLNKQGGHSLIIRIVSETGLLGLVLIIYLLYKYKISKKESVYYYINIACITYFVARCFKLGGYFDFGIYFFIALYFYSYLNDKYDEKNSNYRS
jgi:O-antigen ligase